MAPDEENIYSACQQSSLFDGPLTWLTDGNIHVFLCFASSSAIIAWAGRQYWRTNENQAAFSRDQFAMFPFHLKLLMFAAVCLWGEALWFANVLNFYPSESFSKHNNIIFAYSMSFMSAFTFSTLDGTTVLLLSRSIGVFALRRACACGIAMWVLYSALVYLEYGLPFSKNSLPATHSYYLAYLIFKGLCALLYLALLLWPHSRWTRRRAAAVWVQAFCVFRLNELTGLLLAYFDLFKGNECWAVNVFMLLYLDGRLCWIGYSAFLLEAQWWHGAETDAGGTRKLVHCENGIVEFSCLHPSLYTDLRLSRLSHATSNSERVTITTPLVGYELSGEAAEEMTQVSDLLGQRVEPQSRRRLDDCLGHGRFATEQRALSWKPVPLLNITKLRILSRKMLGTGSSARVYEGRWCGKPCAIKVLFAVEITPEEIRRVCREASLLHDLQGVSPHIVELIGVALHPPSLCVVLELCNEGSLQSLLYDSAEDQRRSRQAPGSIFETVRDSLRLSRPVASNEHAHELPWEHRLDLALGASRGLEAFVSALPHGYSHNDIKSGNFLVQRLGQRKGPSAKDLHFLVKMADMEFATRGVTPAHLNRAETPHWTAPEILARTATVSPASDVYSLASVLYEIVARNIPFGDVPSDAEVARLITEGHRSVFPEIANCLIVERESREKVCTLVQRSWAQSPDDRPSAACIAKELEILHLTYFRSQTLQETRLQVSSF